MSVSLPPYGIGTLRLERGGSRVRPQGLLALHDPVPPAIDKGALLFSDDFSSPTLSKWQAMSVAGKPASPVIPGDSLAASAGRFLRTAETIRGERIVQLKMRISPNAQSDVRLIPWIARDANRYVQAKFAGGWISFQRFDGDVFHDLPNAAKVAIAPDEWHLISVRLTKNRLEVWLDGAFAVDYEGDDLPQGDGYAGFRASAAEIHGMAVFAVPTRPAPDVASVH